MTVLHLWHPACDLHDAGPGHPERPDRLRAIRRAVEEAGFGDALTVVEAPAVTQAALEAVHTRAYLARIERLAADGGGWLDPDTRVAPGTPEAARRAAGAAHRGAEALCAGEAARAFATVRPPGHHAHADRGMGFCLFNNAAVAAVAARQAGRQRVAIVDWDVHHGNGTQAIFWRDPHVLFVSVHQEYWYPGTGAIEEVGEGPGEGFTVNLPLPAQTGDRGYEDAFGEVVVPLLHAFGPDFVVISAGYDAHYADPLGGMVLTARGFGRLAAMVDDAARAHDAPLLGVLEGGYDVDALAASVLATLEVLTGRAAAGLPSEAAPPEAPAALIASRLRAVRRVVLAHWRI